MKRVFIIILALFLLGCRGTGGPLEAEEETRSTLFRFQLQRQAPEQLPKKKKRAMHLSHGDGGEAPVTVKRKGKKIGRNDPCPCGSGKNYKKCC